MDAKEKPVVDTNEEHVPNPLFEATRKILLAGIGAVALGKDEIEDFINKLVERGEIAEKDGRKLFEEIVERRRNRTMNFEDLANKRIQMILDHLNVPTKKDIDSLGEKVAQLATKVEKLYKSQK